MIDNSRNLPSNFVNKLYHPGCMLSTSKGVVGEGIQQREYSHLMNTTSSERSCKRLLTDDYNDIACPPKKLPRSSSASALTNVPIANNNGEMETVRKLLKCNAHILRKLYACQVVSSNSFFKFLFL